ncbi:TRAP transporter small permease [Mesorhizobium sp. CAU 1741]|uniref:TRAP transporter small permease n=1 Tax=Mesorhizobium sp. CAU 1741 TaxID=3140366 RepID=UPI00325B3862
MDFDRTIRLHLARSELAAGLGLVGLLLMGAIIIVDVFMRWILNAPLYGMSDLVELTTPVIVASCLPSAFAARQNITIRFLGRALAPRASQAVELFGQATVIVVLAAIVWQVGKHTAGMINYNQLTWLLGVPVWPSWVLTTILLAACVPIQALVVLETVQNLKLARPLHDEIVDH